MVGKPKYKVGDTVSFKFRDTVLTGQIYIVDKYGTFEQNEEPSYDIMVTEQFNGLHKHYRESELTLVKEGEV